MHPYRTPPTLEATADGADDAGGLRLAFRVMTTVATVQIAIAVPDLGQPSLQTLFSAACFIAGVGWLLRHRQR
jgi:hypothetical protein